MAIPSRLRRGRWWIRIRVRCRPLRDDVGDRHLTFLVGVVVRDAGLDPIALLALLFWCQAAVVRVCSWAGAAVAGDAVPVARCWWRCGRWICVGVWCLGLCDVVGDGDLAFLVGVIVCDTGFDPIGLLTLLLWCQTAVVRVCAGASAAVAGDAVPVARCWWRCGRWICVGVWCLWLCDVVGDSDLAFVIDVRQDAFGSCLCMGP